SSLQVRGADQVLVVTVLAAVLVQVGVATVVAARAAEPGPGRLDGGVARSGVDVLLAAVGVLAFVQLRSHRPVPGSLDPVLVLAPALCVLAVAVLALRVVPVLVRLGEQVARRSTGVVLPLAGWHVARGRAATGMLLTVLATASGTLALATQATWDDAQRLQAAARLAADVRVPADGSAGQGSAILEAARQLDTSALVVPVTDRKVGLGSRPGGAALVALDTRTGAAAIDAPLAGGWAERVAPLAPEVAADPLVVGGAPFDVVVDVTTTGGMDGLTVTPTLVVQDELGRADAVALAPVGADRQATRRVPVEGTPALAGRWRVVAVHLAVTAPTTEPTAPTTELTVAVQVAGATRGSGTWTGTGDGILVLGTPRVTGGGDRLVTRAEISLLGLSYAGATVLVTAFPTREELPVLASATLADELALAPGDTIDLSTGQAVVTAVVAGTVPYVPGRPGEAAVLADSEALTRSLLVDGELEPATDAWWVASDDPVALATAVGGRSSVELGDRLAAGPLRAAAVAALTMLALVAVLLAVAGAFARERAAAPERALEAARLRGLGASRRSVLAATLARHALVTVVAVALGALVGGALASFLAPVLVGSGDAGPVVPAPVPVWPWPQEAALLVTLLSGALVAGVPTARRVASRSMAVVLRSGGAS
ncbi:MAG TPA: ABC transporter permease, partial [Actinotalea sp.]|nr:ABC transporter permease [Actinotalea sp.]